MLVKPHGPARLELLVHSKRKRPYTVRVILGMVRHCREFSTWTKAVQYACALPNFQTCDQSNLPPGNYLFFL